MEYEDAMDIDPGVAVAASSTPSPPKLESERKPMFAGTLEKLEAMVTHFLCVKCGEVPDETIFVLGCCQHLYCEKCIVVQAGKACVKCGAKGLPKDVRKDRFLTDVLMEIPKVYGTLKDAQRKIQEEEDGTSTKDVDNDSPPKLMTQTQKKEKTNEEMEEVSENDEQEVVKKLHGHPKASESMNEKGKGNEKENKNPESKTIDQMKAKESKDVFDVYEFSTPSDQNVPHSPDVLEETPQHKPRISLTMSAGGFKRKGEFKGKKSLNFTDEKKSTEKQSSKMVEEDKSSKVVKVDTPMKTQDEGLELEDEELFRTQQSVKLGKSPMNPPPRTIYEHPLIPILTPHGAIKDSKTITVSNNGSKKALNFKSVPQPSDEPELPTLTPYGKPKQEESTKSDEKPGTSSSSKKRQTRGRQLFKSEGVTPAASGKTATAKLKRPTSASVKVTGQIPVEKQQHSNVPKGNESDGASIDGDKKNLKDKSKPVTVNEKKRRPSSSSTSTKAVGRVSLVAPSPTPSLNDSFSSVKGGKEKRNAKGETALHVACRVGQIDKVQALLEAGSDVDAKDNAGWTPLHEVVNSKKASPEGKIELIRILHKNHCNINAVGGPDQETALHLAVISGLERVVEILMELGASPNIRDNAGKLPGNVAYNDLIITMLKEKGGKVSGSESTMNTSTSSSSTKSYSEVTLTAPEDDPAVLQVMISKANLFFNYDVTDGDLEGTRSQLGLRVAEELSPNVTHIIHKVGKNDGLKVPMSMEYLYGLAQGMWHVSAEWIEQSLHKSKCLSPTPFEIIGYLGSPDCETFQVPLMCRANREKGNPGLLDGFMFYLYKSCGYIEKGLDLTKKDLLTLIVAAGGSITNREPDPDIIYPLEYPLRFHTQLSADPTNPSKFELTTHVILYDDKAPPPPAKMYKLGHVKTLKSDWLIECLANFRLEDPDKYYS